MPHSINVFFLFILMFTLPLPVLHTVYSLYSVLLTLHTVQYVTVHHASPFRPANPVTFSHLPSSSPTSQKNLLPASLLFSLSLSLSFLFLSFFITSFSPFSTLPMWKYRPSSRSDSTSGASFDPPRRNWFGRSKKKSPFCKLPLTLSHFLFSLSSLSIFIFFSFSCCFLFLPIPSFIPSFQVLFLSPDGDLSYTRYFLLMLMPACASFNQLTILLAGLFLTDYIRPASS